MSLELKIKIKSLAAEARFIRKEERKQKGSYLWLKDRDEKDQANNPSDEQRWSWRKHRELHHHRVVDVRKEARASLIAYAYLRGKPLDSVEQDFACNEFKEKPRWDRVLKMVLKYGPGAGEFQPENLVRIERDKLRDWVVASGIHNYVMPNFSDRKWL